MADPLMALFDAPAQPTSASLDGISQQQVSASPDADSKIVQAGRLTCSNCNVDIEGDEAKNIHYKSEWHRCALDILSHTLALPARCLRPFLIVLVDNFYILEMFLLFSLLLTRFLLLLLFVVWVSSSVTM